MDKQLHEAEKQREKINKDIGNIRQDIDTQKVPSKACSVFAFVVAYAYVLVFILLILCSFTHQKC